MMHLILIIFVSLLNGLMTEAVDVIDPAQEVWLPNLRGISLGRPGSTVVEFVVRSGEQEKNNHALEPPRKGPNRIRASITCSDPDAVLTLNPEESNELKLSTSTARLGLFGAAANKLKIEGSCCWEIFDRVGFTGRMLRLCPGSYGPDILGSFAKSIKSVRSIEYFATRRQTYDSDK